MENNKRSLSAQQQPSSEPLSASEAISESMYKVGDILYVEFQQSNVVVKTILRVEEIQGDKLFWNKAITYDDKTESWRKTEEVLRAIEPTKVQQYMDAELFEALLKKPFERTKFVKRHITPEEFELIMELYD